MKFGFRRNEARLYLALVSSGEDSASSLSRATGIDRIDVYRALKSLAEKQAVDIVLGVPRIFRAKSPEIVLRKMYEQEQESLIKIRDTLPELVEQLRDYERTKNASRHEDSRPERYYQLSYGRSNYIRDVTKLTVAAKRDLLIVLTPNAVKRGFSVGTPDLWREKLAQGVSIRIITDRRTEKSKEVKLLSKEFELRSSTSAVMRLTIFDSSHTLICATDDVDLSISNPSDVYLMVNDKRLSLVMQLLFDHMWRNAKPVAR